MPISKTLAALALIGSSATAGAALAGETWADAGTGFRHLFAQAAPAGHTRAPAPTQVAAAEDHVLSLAEIVDRLNAQGYTDIREVERDDGRYEVKARAPDGARRELYLDAKTGAVVKTETDDD